MQIEQPNNTPFAMDKRSGHAHCCDELLAFVSVAGFLLEANTVLSRDHQPLKGTLQAAQDDSQRGSSCLACLQRLWAHNQAEECPLLSFSAH